MTRLAVVDPERCVGCQCCMFACARRHEPGLARTCIGVRSLGGNEMAGYHTGPAAYLGFLMGARHSHLDNAGYSIDQKTLVKERLAPEKLAEALLAEERWRQILSSLVVCFFARGIYNQETVLEALRLAGMDFDADRLRLAGEAIHRAKYRFKMREGFSLDDPRIPERILQTPAVVRDWDAAYIHQALRHVKAEIGES
ncbi:MAG: aldehyde ferredoxin oxidoreductase C-terminal domain-containing protein [Pirellulales bacterium]